MTVPGSDPATRFACVVLAAGAGTRFGEPKAGAEVRPGVRFLDAVIASAAEAGAEPIVVVVQRGVEVPAPARPVIATDPGAEQISSLRLGLAQLANTPASAVLVWPVDHPFATARTARALADAHGRTGAEIVLPVNEGRRGHPALFARTLWRDLMTVSDGGARAVVHAHAGSVLELPVADAGVLRDIDTHADLESAEEDGLTLDLEPDGAEAEEPAGAHLIDEDARGAYPLSRRTITIGRDISSVVRLRDPRVSRFHADIRLEDGGWVLYPMGASGTVVNGERTSAPHALREGDRVSIGRSTFRFTRRPLPADVHPAEGVLELNDPQAMRATLLHAAVTRGGRALASGRTLLWLLALVAVVLAALGIMVIG